MEKRSPARLLLAATAAGILAGCASKPPPPPPKPPGPPPLYTWNPEGARGPASIIVDLTEQRAYFFRGQNCIGETRCSTGKRGFKTVTGDFKVTQKNRNHVSNLYGNIVNAEGAVVVSDADMSKMKVPDGCAFIGAKMPFYMRFHGGYGLHAGKVPNYPASHGCVRLPRIMAERFFEHCEVGTPVTVRE